jgi:hypothetical protein
MIKDFKLKILICFDSPITKHETPLHQTPQIFPHSFTELSNFSSLQSTRWSATKFLWASEAEEQYART